MTQIRLLISVFFICQLFGSVAAQAEAKKPWTVLVYLNADNNLEDFGYGDVQEMEKVGSNGLLNIVVQFDGVSPEGTKRLYIERFPEEKSGDNTIRSRVVEDMPEQDMGIAATFVDFVTWGMKNYPADHYMVIIWNHGSGWDKNRESGFVVRGVSYDDTSGNHLTTNQTADALDEVTAATGNRVDILGFDACLMSMFEIADSLVGMVDYLVASEETEPGDGYPYDTFLKIFDSAAVPTPTAVAKHLVQAYGKSYESTGGSTDSSEYGGYYSSGPSVTNAAIDLSKIELIKRRLNTWLSALQSTKAISTDDIKKAARDSVSFNTPSFKDLGDFVRRVLEKIPARDEAGDVSVRGVSGSTGILGASLALLRSIDDAVIANYVSKRFERATGVSIYLPVSYYGSSGWGKGDSRRSRYLELKWGKTTDWASFLDYLLPEPAQEETASYSNAYEGTTLPEAEVSSSEGSSQRF